MVTLSDGLHRALRRYSLIEDDIAAIGLRSDDARKLALVKSRRKLAEEIGLLAPMIEADEELLRDTDKQREMSRLFAAMRYALAAHQADWPTVSIDDDPAAYRTSTLAVIAKSDAFWDWCNINLGLHRDQIGA